MWWEEGTNWYSGDHKTVGKEPLGMVSARLESHTDSEFGNRDSVERCSGSFGYSHTFIVGLRNHCTASKCYRGPLRAKAG